MVRAKIAGWGLTTRCIDYALATGAAVSIMRRSWGTPAATTNVNRELQRATSTSAVNAG